MCICKPHERGYERHLYPHVSTPVLTHNHVSWNTGTRYTRWPRWINTCRTIEVEVQKSNSSHSQQYHSPQRNGLPWAASESDIWTRVWCKILANSQSPRPSRNIQTQGILVSFFLISNVEICPDKLKSKLPWDLGPTFLFFGYRCFIGSNPGSMSWLTRRHSNQPISKSAKYHECQSWIKRPWLINEGVPHKQFLF